MAVADAGLMPIAIDFDAPLVFGTTASIAATAAFLGGLTLGWWYRKKATLSISAEAYRTNFGFVIAARPSISSVGPFRLKFADTDGDVVLVWGMLATAELGFDPAPPDKDQSLEAFPGHEW